MSSEYEQNIASLISEKMAKLELLLTNSNTPKYEIDSIRTEIETLQSLFENYNLGMNVFRRARGGRAGLRD